MGLNDAFIGVRSNILLSSPLPSIGQAYSLIIQDEKQREIHVPVVSAGDSSSFLASNQTGRRKFNDYKAQQSLICSYCKKTGYTVDKCYRIHGFSADFKFTKQRKYQGSTAQVNNKFRFYHIPQK